MRSAQEYNDLEVLFLILCVRGLRGKITLHLLMQSSVSEPNPRTNFRLLLVAENMLAFPASLLDVPCKKA